MGARRDWLTWARIMPQAAQAACQCCYRVCCQGFALIKDVSHHENLFAALPHNFSMQEKVFRIEILKSQAIDLNIEKKCLV
jgi:hypothetical protein